MFIGHGVSVKAESNHYFVQLETLLSPLKTTLFPGLTTYMSGVTTYMNGVTMDLTELTTYFLMRYFSFV